jgi:hypothetical protein
MTSIYNSKSNALGYSFVHLDTIADLFLLPDLNIDINPKLVESAKQHPIFKADLLNGVIRIIETEVPVVGKKEGLDYTDLKEKEEVLVTSQEKLELPRYMPDRATLVKYSGVADRTASLILANMPKGGWASKTEFKKDTEKYQIDWSPEGLKEHKKPAK